MSAPLLDSPWTGQTFSPATAIDIATIEAQIVAQLQTFLAAALGSQMIEVIHFPDKPEAYELRHQIGTATVIYNGASYGPILDIGHVAQERTMEFAVGLRIRDLGWAFGGPLSGPSPGAYQILETARMALLGFQPTTGCTPMKAIREHFLDRDRQGGVWVYELVLATRTLVVENYQPPNFPLFTKGTGLEEGGQTSFSVQIEVLTFSGTPGSITLPQQNISALVVKSQNLAITYMLNTDYSLDNVNGIIARFSTGSIPPNAAVAVSYAYSDVVTTLASGGSAPFYPNN
jgi:hypothetical protein